jgi:type II restriction/modification system DNA methylase subunit YeeA
MTPQSFIRKWKPVALTERAVAQSHFNDLCALLGHDDPVTADPTGEWFTFEKGVTKTGGGEGFADVWKRGHFAWEYKRKKRNLDDALAQLVRYAAALENPPLQVACDTDRFLIRTAWTNAVPKTYEIALDELAEPSKLDILRAVFFEPEKLRPKETRAAVTKEAADKFSTIALRLQGRGTPEEIAHFVNQLVFCFFANSVKLLPEGFFPRLLRRAAEEPQRAQDYFNHLFAAMESGGDFGLEKIAFFNGGLFDGRRALPLDSGDIGLLQAAASLDWSQIDPTIFGTLFERFLDPDKRAQIGAHYTDPDKIMMIVEPVILRPLRAEWAQVKAEVEKLVEAAHLKRARAFDNAMGKAEEVRSRFLERLRNLTILDPACGSGNFLYLALQNVKDLELKANLECEALGLAPRVPAVGPEIVHGIEINPLAAELARTTIWIGDIQWRLRNGIHARPQPILRKLDAIECRDALISRRADGSYVEAEWPAAEFIVGNPPFLGIRLMRTGLGDETVERLFEVYQDRVSREADLVVYWFEKAHNSLILGRSTRVGLVATNSIRGGPNRRVLEEIAEAHLIFEAWSDEPWIIEGAAVRVSLICFGRGSDSLHLDGKNVSHINADLTAGTTNFTKAKRLLENLDVAFMGDTKGGAFDVPGELARSWLQLPVNPNGRSNAEVLRPWRNGMDITRRSRDMWIIDFGWEMSEREASLFEAPFGYIQEHVYPERAKNRRDSYRTRWWRHVEPRPGMWLALKTKQRAIVTPEVSRHRVFSWLSTSIVPDHKLQVIARDDDTTFGILLSKWHLAWSLRLGSWHGVGNDPRYTISSSFETFPFPEGLTPNIPAEDYADDPRAQAIAKAAKRLDELRNNWLNPPDLVRIEPEVVPGFPDRILPKDTVAAAKLRERTLTKLYNERPQWLVDAHRDLDAAVAAAYGWPADISEEEALAKLLELNLARAGTPAPVNTGFEEEPPETDDRRLGRQAFAKISEVEGIRLSKEAEQAFEEFDAQGLSPDERRRAIIGRFKRPAG